MLPNVEIIFTVSEWKSTKTSMHDPRGLDRRSGSLWTRNCTHVASPMWEKLKLLRFARWLSGLQGISDFVLLLAVGCGWPCTLVSFIFWRVWAYPAIQGFEHQRIFTHDHLDWCVHRHISGLRYHGAVGISAQDHASAGITMAGTAKVFAWKGDWVTSLRSFFHFRQKWKDGSGSYAVFTEQGSSASPNDSS